MKDETNEVTIAVDTSMNVDQELVEFVNNELSQIKFVDDFSVCLDPDVAKAYKALYRANLEASMTKCFFDMSGSRRMGKILKMNEKTVWVKVMIGARDHINIKRHIEKHHVMVY